MNEIMESEKKGSVETEFIVVANAGVVKEIHNGLVWHPKIVYKGRTTKWCNDKWKK